jgi:drug/metabolite transporter (DMT)-like permease
MVLIGGSNAVAVGFSNKELPPFWGAAIRFGAAALVFWFVTLVRRISLPRGKTLTGAVLFGLIATGFTYAFLYWGLLQVPAGLTMVVLAFVPLFTLLFAIAHGLEKFRWRGLIGGLIALAGIVISVSGSLGDSVPVPYLLAVIAGGICIAEGSVVYKLFPSGHPIPTNAIAVSTGALFLLSLSIITGEQWTMPTSLNTWVAFAYLVLMGSVVLFYLILYVLNRWDASVTAYSFLLFPIATVIIASLLTEEVITISFVIGGAIVLAGVWVGAIKSSGTAANSDPTPATDESMT